MDASLQLSDSRARRGMIYVYRYTCGLKGLRAAGKKYIPSTTAYDSHATRKAVLEVCFGLLLYGCLGVRTSNNSACLEAWMSPSCTNMVD